MREPGKPRRSPAPEERQADADRTRRVLLAAAYEEFAEKGYAGARVHEIAARANVNKQLINYYFGGKEGLYRTLQSQWLKHEATFHDPGRSAADIATSYLHGALDDPRGTRLMVWRGLSYAAGQETPDEEPEQDLSGITERQQAGEIDQDLDPACLLLGMMALTTAPLVMPDMVKKTFGVEATDPAFRERYTAFLRDMMTRLGPRR
ncbi:TetR family transcriptional regulator [Kibdelosporangium philippinense]|uniref:TetR family transcriptional regulator n=1 Tax=Kibdelosporangium philippinense TaxID=211113 RepID=A0ABS8ZQN3_9PSEU|nr:TetR family transcriptional regulator [Kibdelosporangium philippinense]MCE7008778.1 TetR family transcriptional regulator [Kibdelosporangium philippinense]